MHEPHSLVQGCLLSVFLSGTWERRDIIGFNSFFSADSFILYPGLKQTFWSLLQHANIKAVVPCLQDKLLGGFFFFYSTAGSQIFHSANHCDNLCSSSWVQSWHGTVVLGFSMRAGCDSICDRAGVVVRNFPSINQISWEVCSNTPKWAVSGWGMWVLYSQYPKGHGYCIL